ncbi:unknown [Eggerthella sp. CAG:1427]|nr:unknown [Eggerthella sp. CAG:1427]
MRFKHIVDVAADGHVRCKQIDDTADLLVHLPADIGTLACAYLFRFEKVRISLTGGFVTCGIFRTVCRFSIRFSK